jgi:hypothetical protein
LAIVPALNELKDGGTCLYLACELSVCTFCFQGCEETLHDSIIIAIASSAHTHLAM